MSCVEPCAEVLSRQVGSGALQQPHSKTIFILKFIFKQTKQHHSTVKANIHSAKLFFPPRPLLEALPSDKYGRWERRPSSLRRRRWRLLRASCRWQRLTCSDVRSMSEILYRIGGPKSRPSTSPGRILLRRRMIQILLT